MLNLAVPGARPAQQRWRLDGLECSLGPDARDKVLNLRVDPFVVHVRGFHRDQVDVLLARLRRDRQFGSGMHRLVQCLRLKLCSFILAVRKPEISSLLT